LAAAGGLAGAASAAPVDLFYERTVMIAADERCRLFTSDIAQALAVGQAQARGAALRGGTDEKTLEDVERRARGRAGSVPCKSKDIAVAAARVKDAFAGYSRITRQVYPGDHADWRADRENGRTLRWRLAQSTRFAGGDLTFGMAGRDGPSALLAVTSFPDGGTPYTARLVMRDPSRSLGPYLDRRGLAPKARLPLARRLPPAGAQKSFFAEARSAAGADLLPKGRKAGWAFRFPAEAARELARLDPREAVAVEFVFSGSAPRDTVRRAYIEVGDFAAGRAFVQMAQR
jgi:hypothetical protein